MRESEGEEEVHAEALLPMSYIRAWKVCKTLVVNLHSILIKVIFSMYVELCKLCYLVCLCVLAMF